MRGLAMAAAAVDVSAKVINFLLITTDLAQKLYISKLLMSLQR